MKYFINCISFMLFLSILSCNGINIDKIKGSTWKYDNGFHIGDFVQFDDKNYRIDNDLFIFKNGSKVASIKKCNNKEMIIVSSTNNSRGRYVFFSR